jgi:hypothetical protein
VRAFLAEATLDYVKQLLETMGTAG